MRHDYFETLRALVAHVFPEAKLDVKHEASDYHRPEAHFVITYHDILVCYCKRTWSRAGAWNHLTEILESSRGPWRACHSATHWSWRAARV